METHVRLFDMLETTAVQDSGIAGGTKHTREPYINTKTGEVVLSNLPLWRVQWTVVPGSSQQLHVHVPHYTHMFKSVLSGAPPRLFGHLYLPGSEREEEVKIKKKKSKPVLK